jgi:hypothetical protein
MNDDQALRDFVAKYARPYDPETDDYDRPPFAADIKEGKNDPIYNAHSYHTKVPPRGIIPYILHYTKRPHPRSVLWLWHDRCGRADVRQPAC